MKKEINVIKRQIENLDSEDFNMNSWILTTDNFLKNIWGKDTEKSKQLYVVCNTMETSMFGCDEEDILKFKKQWKDLLNGYVLELELLEKPENHRKQVYGGINLTVNQNQSQEQIQMIELKLIVDIIKDELTGKQLNELKSIIQDTKIEKKNEKIAEKFISFGSNVASGILGNILSNPQLYGLL
ncbi:MAG: hypothetical protein VB102_13475 [Paludibacter sp.]|nr:hypothetical protein [Paludibacter sp.]